MNPDMRLANNNSSAPGSPTLHPNSTSRVSSEQSSTTAEVYSIGRHQDTKNIKLFREEIPFVDFSMDPLELADAIRYIEGYLGKTLHINSRDGRLFVGTFKCVDNENNVILSTSHEYRMPTEKAQKRAESELAAGRGNGTADMTSRFVGLIVIPGKEITKIEVEEPRPVQYQAALPVRIKES